MLLDARIENSRNPQVVIEQLARKQISDQEAEKLLIPLWERAYAPRTVLATIASFFIYRSH